MSTTKPLAILLAVLMVTTGLGAAAGSTYDTGTDTYAVDAQLDDGAVTVTVTNGDAGVENATVAVDDETVGETGANGTVTFERPDDEFDLHVETNGAELKQEYRVVNGSLVLDGSEFEMEDAEDESDDEENESDDEQEESEQGDDSDEQDDSDAEEAESADSNDEREESDDAEEERNESADDSADEQPSTETADADATASGVTAQQGSVPSQASPVAAIQNFFDSFLSTSP